MNNSSLKHYQSLQKYSLQQSAQIGLQLPALQTGKLILDAQSMHQSQLNTVITDFAAQQGWMMITDQVLLGVELPAESVLLEAEFVRDETTLVIRLITGDHYVVTQQSSTIADSDAEESVNEMVFAEQLLCLRPDLSDHLFARYRLWWQQSSRQEKHAEGRWIPWAQQFMGYTQ